MGKPSAPPPPDYAGAAAAQGEANKDTAMFNAGINRPNEQNQYGARTWTLRPGADPKNPQPGDYVLSTELNGTQQGLLDSTNRISQGFLNAGESGLGGVGSMMNSQFNPNLPQFTGGVGSPQSPYLTQQMGGIQSGLNPGTNPVSGVGTTTQSGQGPNLRAGMSTDTADATRQKVQEALMARINPYYDQQESGLRSRLMNSGLEMGSEAWNSENQRLSQSRTDATNQATISAGQEASRILADQRANEQSAAGINAQQFNLGLNQQGQAFGQSLQAGQFANDASAGDFQRRLQAGEFGNQAQQQSFGQQLAGNQSNNSALNQYFQQQLQGGTFGNQARGQSLQEALMMRELPMNEVNALRTGNQVGSFQPSSFYNAQQSGGNNIMDALMGQQGADNQKYAADMQGYNSTLGSLASVAAAYFMYASDARLKTNLRQIGTHPTGIPRYKWDWKDGSGSESGVLAQDLQTVRPDAVSLMPNGYLGVRYDLIGGR